MSKAQKAVNIDDVVGEMRNALGVPERVTNPEWIPIGYLLSLTNRTHGGKCLIDNFLPEGSISLFAVENRVVAEKLDYLMGNSVAAGNQVFFGKQAQQGGVLIYPGDTYMETHASGKLTQRATDDSAYFPFLFPLPPDCGFIKDLNQSGIRLNHWVLHEHSQTEGQWLREAEKLVHGFGYITETRNAAVICPSTYPKSMDLAIRAFKQSLTPGLTLDGYQLELIFREDGGCGLKMDPIEDLAERVEALDIALELETGPDPDLVAEDRFYWMDGEARTLRVFCKGNPVEKMHDGEYIVL
jgi:hypothetical protein